MGTIEPFLARAVGQAGAESDAACDRARGAERLWQAALDMAGRLKFTVDTEREAAVTTAALAVAGAQPLVESIEALDASASKLAIVDAIGRQTLGLLHEARAEAAPAAVDERLFTSACRALEALGDRLADTHRLLARLAADCLQRAHATNDPQHPGHPAGGP